MLSFLSGLQDIFGPFRLFSYVTFRAAGAGLTAFLLVALLGGWMAQVLRRWNAQAASRYKDLFPPEWVDKEKEKTPCMGGLLLIGAVLVASLLWNELSQRLSWMMILGTLGFAAIGFWDDARKVFFKDPQGIPGKLKLLLQFLVAGLLLWGLYGLPELGDFMTKLFVPLKKDPVDVGGWLCIFSALVIVGASNAVNLTDGKDGLATGCTISCLLTYGALAYLTGHKVFATYLNIPFVPGISEVMVFIAAVIGACIGFLWHNCHPASMFMGDTGSLALGGAVGLAAVITRQELLMIIAGGVFVMEALSVMIQVTSFKLTKKRIFLCTPIHHHFERLGWKETQIVTRFWILSGLFALIALAALKLR